MQVAVIGAGSTGHGVARMPAMAGHDVRLDIAEHPREDMGERVRPPDCSTEGAGRRPRRERKRASTSERTARPADK